MLIAKSVALQKKIVQDFAESDLKDPRLDRRLRAVMRNLSAHPAGSFPDAFPVSAELEGFYRFVNNTHVSPEAILAPYYAATRERIAQAGRAYFIHDTTEFCFSGSAEREGLSQARARSQGFLGHFALAVATDGTRQPLGVVGYKTWMRQKKVAKTKKSRRKHNKSEENEARRWWELTDAASQSCQGEATVIHLMDREGDSYELLARLMQKGHHFVIRLKNDRAIVDEEGAKGKQKKKKISQVLADVPYICERQVAFGERRHERKDITGKKHPERSARVATLSLHATTLTIAGSDYVDASLPKSLTVNVVRVHEQHPPTGEAPIQWTLLTTEPIDTIDQIFAVVDAYCTRWVIEEFFKALKTGCAYETRQLDNSGSLLNALALLTPIACQLLEIRNLGRSNSDIDAADVLGSFKLKVLCVMAGKCGYVLAENPSIASAMIAIAKLAGFIVRPNKQPGWRLLWNGYRKLLDYEVAWNAAQQDAAGETM